ncbi:MAG: dipeptidase PepV [Bacillota bacterium]|nr:dipeptidase PepV [Bacillota bacterium]
MNLNKIIDNYENEIIKSTQEIIKIKSIEENEKEGMPFGEGVNNALKNILNLCQNLGFKTKNVNNYAGFAEIGSGNETIGILVHLDVVPEGDLSTWKFPPYSATISDGKIFGRGAIDDKGPAIAAIYAMKALLDSNENINKKIRIIFGLNEETHWKSINYYLKHEEIPDLSFTPDADFPVIHGEKGILVFNINKIFKEKINDAGIEIISIDGGNRPNMVPDYAEAKLIENKPFKHILDAYNSENNINIEYEQHDNYVTLKSYGILAHGATPEKGKNAISYLINFLALIDLQISDTSSFIRFFSNHISTEINGETIGCQLEDEISGKLTFNVGTIKLDETSVQLGINIRYPITFNEADVYNGIDNILSTSIYNFDNKIKIEKIEHMNPIYFEKNHKLIETLMTVYKRHTKDNSEPLTIGGGTYARSMKNAVAFGPLFPGREGTEHQSNEYIYIEDLMLATKIYADALRELTK